LLVVVIEDAEVVFGEAAYGACVVVYYNIYLNQARAHAEYGRFSVLRRRRRTRAHQCHEPPTPGHVSFDDSEHHTVSKGFKVVDWGPAQSYNLNKRMNERPDTKTRILDAAEKLFGINGFQATSLRDITNEAGVNLAAVNYHFQSKDSLIDAVIERRVSPLNQARLALLDAAGPSPALEDILVAFLKPVLQVEMEPLVPLLGRILSNPEVFVDRVFNRHMVGVSQRFSQELARVLPELSRLDLLWRLHFSIGVMAQTMLWGRIYPKLTGGLCSIDDREALLARMVNYVAAGFRAGASSEWNQHV
jgi:AcrR family transcriptional regulator